MQGRGTRTLFRHKIYRKIQKNKYVATKYPMWNDVRTYLNISFEAEEKSLLFKAFSYFKKTKLAHEFEPKNLIQSTN